MNKNNTLRKSMTIILSLLLFLIINSLLTSAAVDLVLPEDNTHTNQQNLTFEYFVNLNNTISCTLIINTNPEITDTNISDGFNQFEHSLDTGTHTWEVECSNTNTTETSEQRTIIIDTAEPNIVLVSPKNNTQINQPNVDITFIAINTPAENSSCEIILDTVVENTIIAEDSNPTITIMTNLTEGMHEWNITCYDQANNSATTETRIFTVNTTQPEEPAPEFNITIEQTEYTIGEYGLMTISAPQGTSVKVEICPNEPGFVECEIPVIGNNIMNYPFQEYLSFTNYEGAYILEAFFNYSNTTEIQTLSYTVNNNIIIDIDVDKNPRVNVPLEIEAEASGGVGILNYTWQLSSHAQVNQQEEGLVNVTYTEEGNHTETVFVKDEYNNTKSLSRTIDVSSVRYVQINVKDAVTSAAIQDASVEIEDEQRQTDSNGHVDFYLKEGRREIIVLEEGYSIYMNDLNITQDETFTILLQTLNQTEPEVILTIPENQANIMGPTTDLFFKVEHNMPVNCSIYINENQDGFYIYLGSRRVSDNSEQRFGVIDLENITYWWKVECVDDTDNSMISQTREFTVGEDSAGEVITAGQQSEASQTFDDWVFEFEQILDSYENLANEDKTAAENLGIINTIKKAITIFKNTIRDLDSVNFRNDLSEPEKESEKQKIILNAQEIYEKAPISLEVLKSESFVDYIDNKELEELMNEYLEIEDISTEINKKKLLEFLDELQQEVVISTKIKSLRINYNDGTQKEISAVFREVKTYDLTPGAFILEIIPKEVAQTADEIISPQKYTVVKQDPIISFELKDDTTIIYYFEKSIQTDLLKNIKTAVMLDPDSMSDDQITGLASKSFSLSKFNTIIFLPIIIILFGGLVFVSVKYNGPDLAKYMFYKTYGKKSLHYIQVILNELNDNLEAGDAKKAISLYQEAKEAYSELSILAKNDIYDKVVEVTDRMGIYNNATQNNTDVDEIKQMITNIPSMLSQGQVTNALEEYKRIEEIYNQLEEKTKEILHPSLVSLGNKIQIVIENEQNKI